MKLLLIIFMSLFFISCGSEENKDIETQTNLDGTVDGFGDFLIHSNPKQYKINEKILVEDLQNYHPVTEQISLLGELNFDDGQTLNDNIRLDDNGKGLPNTWAQVDLGYQLNMIDGKEMGSAKFNLKSETEFNYVALEFDMLDYVDVYSDFSVMYEVKNNDDVIRSNTTFAFINDGGTKVLIPINLMGNYLDVDISIFISSEYGNEYIASEIDVKTYNFSDEDIIDLMKYTWLEEGEMTASETVDFIGDINVDSSNVMLSKPVLEFSHVVTNLDYYYVDVRMHSDDNYLYYYFSEEDQNELLFEFKVHLNERNEFYDGEYQFVATYTDQDGSRLTQANLDNDFFKLNRFINIDGNSSFTVYNVIPTGTNFLINLEDKIVHQKTLIEFEDVTSLTRGISLSSKLEDGKLQLNQETKEELNQYTDYYSYTRFINSVFYIEFPLMTGMVEFKFDAEVDVENEECFLESYEKFIVSDTPKGESCIRKSATYTIVKNIAEQDYAYFYTNMRGGQEFVDNYYQITIDNISVSQVEVSNESWQATWVGSVFCEALPFEALTFSLVSDEINGVILGRDINDVSNLNGSLANEILSFDYKDENYVFDLVDESGLASNSSFVIFKDSVSECELMLKRYVP